MTKLENINQEELQAAQLEHVHNYPAADMNSGEYVESVISSTATRGPLGSNLHGWITYRNGAGKIHIEKTSEESGAGWFAYAGTFPTVFALNPDILKGKSGWAQVVVAGVVGTLTLYLEGSGVPVLTVPLVGPAAGGGSMKCKVKYTFFPD